MKTFFSSAASYFIGAYILLIIGSCIWNPPITFIAFLCGSFWFIVYTGYWLGSAESKREADKFPYKVLRINLGALIILSIIVQIILGLINGELFDLFIIRNKFYNWLIGLSLATYLFSFRPSNCSHTQKALKVLGLICLYISIVPMQFITPIINISFSNWDGITSSEIGSDLIIVLLSIVFFAIGLELLYFAYNDNKASETNQLTNENYG